MPNVLSATNYFGNKLLKYLIISISKKRNAGVEDVIFKKIIAL